jgi:hypothetical protein
MNDQIAIQYALFRGMRSCALFNALNVVLGREYLASKVQQDAIWQTPAPGGEVGVGAIVQIPSLMFPKSNSLQRERQYSIGIYEEPDSNFTPEVGTFRGADDWGDVVIDFLWNWTLWRSSGLILRDAAIVPDAKFLDQGIVGVKAVCYLRQERRQPARCATPQIVNNNYVITLSSTDGSDIYYTTDGFSTPAPDNNGSLPGEQAAQKFGVPFQVAPGAVILAASYPNANTPGIQLPGQTSSLLVN